MYINTFAVRFISYSDFRDIKYCLEEMTEHICLGGRESKSMQVFPEINPKRSSPLRVRQPQPRQSWEVIKISAIIACLERCTLGRKDALALQRRREQSKIISHCVQRLPPTQMPHKALIYSHVDESTNANANTCMEMIARCGHLRRDAGQAQCPCCTSYCTCSDTDPQKGRGEARRVCAQGGSFWVTGSLLVPHLAVTAGSWEAALPLGEHLGKIPPGPS